jgi:hypothetical protein
MDNDDWDDLIAEDIEKLNTLHDYTKNPAFEENEPIIDVKYVRTDEESDDPVYYSNANFDP